MPQTIPEVYLDLLDAPVTAALATLMPDGQPQVHPVWCDYDGTYVRVNTAEGRQKWRNMRDRPQVTLLLQDPGTNGYRALEIRGEVAEMTTKGADTHIHMLARKYTGKPYPFDLPSIVRVMVKIRPTRVMPIDISTRFEARPDRAR